MAGQKRKFPTASRFAKVAKQSMAVQKLDSKLKAYQRRDTQWTQYRLETVPTVVIGQAYMWHLHDKGSWVKTFGPDPGGIVYQSRMEYDINVKIAAEVGPVAFTAYMVALRPDTADQLIHSNFLTNGPIPNIHYVAGTQEGVPTSLPTGQAYLNPQYFIIKKKWAFHLGKNNYADSVTRDMKDTNKRLVGTIPWSKRLHSGLGDFDDATFVDNSAKLFFLLFSDNVSGFNGSPHLDGIVMHHVKST